MQLVYQCPTCPKAFAALSDVAFIILPSFSKSDAFDTVDLLDTLKFLCIGNSCWPIINHRAEVDVFRLSTDEVRPGQFVVFIGNRLMVCHRVLMKRTVNGLVWFLVRGDSSREPDGWIPSYRVVGKVVAVNGKSLEKGAMRTLTQLFFIYSLLVVAFHFILFETRVGIAIGNWRSRLFPAFSFKEAFYRLTAPWPSR